MILENEAMYYQSCIKITTSYNKKKMNLEPLKNVLFIRLFPARKILMLAPHGIPHVRPVPIMNMTISEGRIEMVTFSKVNSDYFILFILMHIDRANGRI